MANADHYALLGRGVRAWNADRPLEADLSSATLRKANLRDANLRRTDLGGANLGGADLVRADLTSSRLGRANLSGANAARIDLTGADLRGAVLTRANLMGATLDQADLAGAELADANLAGANLHHTVLAGANLAEANLAGADFSHADLAGTDLSHAHLTETTFDQVDLTRVDLRGANCIRTVWRKVDLRLAVNLAEVVHHGPSIVDVETLGLTRGAIPDVFLRGCGIDDHVLSSIPGLGMTGPFQHYSAYLLCGTNDAEIGRRLQRRLSREDTIPTWLDAHEPGAPDDLTVAIDRARSHVDRAIVLCSSSTLGAPWLGPEIERWTGREAQLARTGQHVAMLIAVDLDGRLQGSDDEHAIVLRSRSPLSAIGWQDDPEVVGRVGGRLARMLTRPQRSPLRSFTDLV